MTSDYIKDYYGICTLDKCVCLKYYWKGRLCQHWASSNANTFEELANWQRKLNGS